MVKTFSHLPSGYNKIPKYLIGYPAYSVTLHCMKEFQSCKNDAEKIFNNMLRAARNPIECVFGRRKARWLILTGKMDLKLEIRPKVILMLLLKSIFLFSIIFVRSTIVPLIKIWLKARSSETWQRNHAAHQNVPDSVYSTNCRRRRNGERHIRTKYLYQFA